MSDSDPLLERLSRAADVATGDDERAATFARGLILGALVGAAIAGSTIWQRRQARLAAKLAAPIPSDLNKDARSGPITNVTNSD